MTEKLEAQLKFLIEVDKMKGILRQTLTADGAKRENDAEHSWHFALAAIIFKEYAHSDIIDFDRVVRMALVHDLVEVYAGDTFAYDKKGYEDKEKREKEAADKLFSILDEEQGNELKGLWVEFEQNATPEAKYANALDRFMPLLLNFKTEGHTWKLRDDITSASVYERMEPVKYGIPPLWEVVCGIIEESVKRGYLKR